MEIKERLEKLIESKESAIKYVEAVKSVLPELQQLMECILEAQDAQDQSLIQYLLGIVIDTNRGIENQDEVLLRDVLEYGWYSLVMDIMGEDASDNI